MTRSRFSMLLGAAVLSVVIVGCMPGASGQLTELRSYIERVKPVSDSLDKEGAAFEAAMTQEGAPDKVALGSIRGSLQTSIDTLKAIDIADQKINEAHGHLIAGITGLQTAVDQLIAVLSTPDSAPPDFDEKIGAQMSAADTEINLWLKSISEMLPEEERADFLSGTN